MKLLSLAIIFMVLFGSPLFVFAQSEGSVSSEGGGSESSSDQEGADKTIIESLPMIEIRRLEKKEPLYSIELRYAQIVDFFRLIAHDYDFNVLVEESILENEEVLASAGSENSLLKMDPQDIVKYTDSETVDLLQ